MNYHRICQKLKTKSQHTNCVVKSLEYIKEKLKIGIGWDFAENLRKTVSLEDFPAGEKNVKMKIFILT